MMSEEEAVPNYAEMKSMLGLADYPECHFAAAMCARMFDNNAPSLLNCRCVMVPFYFPRESGRDADA